MDQAGGDYVLAGRVLHAGSIIMTHAVEVKFSEVRGYKRAAVCGSQAPYRDRDSLARPVLAIDGYIRVENPLRAVASCYGPTSPRISMVGPVTMPRGKEPQRGGEDSLGDDTRGGLE